MKREPNVSCVSVVLGARVAVLMRKVSGPITVAEAVPLSIMKSYSSWTPFDKRGEGQVIAPRVGEEHLFLATRPKARSFSASPACAMKLELLLRRLPTAKSVRLAAPEMPRLFLVFKDVVPATESTGSPFNAFWITVGPTAGSRFVQTNAAPAVPLFAHSVTCPACVGGGIVAASAASNQVAALSPGPIRWRAR